MADEERRERPERPARRRVARAEISPAGDGAGAGGGAAPESEDHGPAASGGDRPGPGGPRRTYGGGPGDRGRPGGGRPYGDRGGFSRDRGPGGHAYGGQGFSADRGPGGRRPSSGGGSGGFDRDRGASGDRRPFGGGGGFQDRGNRGGGTRPEGRSGGDRPWDRDRREGGADRSAGRQWSDRPPRPFDRFGSNDRGGSSDRSRGGFGRPTGRPSGDRPYGDRPDRPDRPSGPRPDRPYGDRPERPRRPEGQGQREGHERGGFGGRSPQDQPAGGGWQDRQVRPDHVDRADRGDRGERGERPDRDFGDRPERGDAEREPGVDRGRSEWTGEGRPLYRPVPGRGTPPRNAWRPERRDDRYSRGSSQDRVGGSGESGEKGASTDALTPPELLGADEELVAGRRPVAEAFAARRPAKRLLVVPDRRQALEQLVIHATALRIPVVEVEGGTLTSVSGFDGHQGIALVVEPRRWATLDDVLARAVERGEPPLVLVLDSLEDPQNVGTLLRTAEANGVHGVVFPTRRSAPISPAAIKASAGAVEHLLLVPLDDLAGGLVDLRSRGLRIVGADEDAPLSYRDADLRGPLALVIGSEGHGISGVVHRRLDLAVRIPMRGKIASLNAAVAGSVLLFEAASQRGLGETDRPTTAEPALLVDSAPAQEAQAEDAPALDEAVSAPKRTRKTKAGATSVAPPPPPEAEASSAAPEESAPEPVPKPKRMRKASSEPAVTSNEDLLPEPPPAKRPRKRA